MLIQVLPTFVPMQYNTALGFLLCGSAILALRFERDAWATALGGIAGLIGALTLVEYALGLNLGIGGLRRHTVGATSRAWPYTRRSDSSW